MTELDKIKALIPQREPFLFIDKIIEKSETNIRTSYSIRGDEYFFQGHFPGHPVMPAVIIQEAVFQSAAALVGGDDNGLGVVSRVTDGKFKKMLIPGDVMEIEVVKDDSLANASFFSGKVLVNNKVAAVLKFSVALIKD